MCCKAELVEDFKNNPRDHHDPIEIYTCSKCKKECEVDEVCAECGGTGEVDVPAEVRGGEIYGPDTRPCSACYKKDDDDYDQHRDNGGD